MEDCSFLIKSKDKKKGKSTYYVYHYLTDDEASDFIETVITFKKNKEGQIRGHWFVNKLRYQIIETKVGLRGTIYVHSEGDSDHESVLSLFKLPYGYRDGIDLLWGIGFGLTLEGDYPFAVKMLLSCEQIEPNQMLKIFKKAKKTPQNSVLIERDLRAELPDDDGEKIKRHDWKNGSLAKIEEFYKKR
jgi:hypothetical protein